MNGKKKPPALNIFCDNIEQLLELENVELGNVMRAAMIYYMTDDLPDDLSRVEQFAFMVLKSGIDRSAATYQARCEKNRENIGKRYRAEE